jgi:hypothetical protein
MSSSILIRLGGLVAMVGGGASAILGLLYVLQARGMTLESTEKALQKGHYENPIATILLVGVLAAIAALHGIQRRHYGRQGALASVGAFVGVAMTVGGTLFSPILLIVGVVAASVGVVGLGIATLGAQILPRWCGVALIAGSPPSVGLEFVLLGSLGAATVVPGEIAWTLVGLPWVLVGYAIFRAAGRRTDRPPRVR